MAHLTGRHALVTGGSRGIGAAIAARLARDGAHVLVNYAKSREAAEAVVAAIVAAGGRATAVGGDVGSAAAVAALFGAVDRATGGVLDVLVNNAGVFHMNAVGQDAEADYDRVFDTNVRGVFLVTTAATPRLRDHGRVITVGSVVGESVMGPNLGLYAASKFALHGFTRSWARDLAARKITVNTVAPGPIDTDMNPANGPMSDFLKTAVPAGRYGTAEEVAAAVAFLASPEASYVTAATLNVGGGIGS